MSDSFIATVLTNNGDGTWTVAPKITEYDGTPHVPIIVNAVNGLFPSPGDVVMIVTARNNLNDSFINRFYEASESNGRIVAIATPIIQYTFKGDYEIIGNLTLLGDLTVTGDITATGNITVAQDITATGSITATDITLSGKSFLTHTHANNAPAPGPTGPPI